MRLFEILFGKKNKKNMISTASDESAAKPSAFSSGSEKKMEYDFKTRGLSQWVTFGRNGDDEAAAVVLNRPESNFHKVIVQHKDFFEEMVSRARLGDTDAMHQLAIWFRNKLSSDYLALETTWETAPEETQESFNRYIKENPEEFVHARAGMMWHIRAALYGNQESNAFLENHSALKTLSLFLENLLIPGTQCNSGETGVLLRSIGLPDFSEDQRYSISSLSEEGFFIATTYAGYEGPDEDGFGMEELNNIYCFDEFFCLLGKRLGYSDLDYQNCKTEFIKQCLEKQLEFQTQRERYWNSVDLPKESQRYHELMTHRHTPVIQGEILVHYFGSQTEYVIPSNVKIIGSKAFTGNTHIKSIIVPEQVTKIEYGAFSSCPELEKLILPDHLEVLGEFLCYDSRKLKQVHLPRQLRVISRGMFKFNKGIKTIELPPNLREIGDCAFLYSNIHSIELPKSLVTIGASAFYGSHIRTIHIPANVTLGKEVFKFCKSLEEVYIEDGITEIPQGCFSQCESLKSVRLPETTVQIDIYAFCKNKELKTLRIPPSVTTIWCSGHDFGSVILRGVEGSYAEKFAFKSKLSFIPD